MSDMSEIDFNVEPNGDEIAEIKAKRWPAIEGFNSAPGLSPMARRLGIALICKMNSRSGECFPGETRLAKLLGAHLSAVKKAKVELRKVGLIYWINPGGRRHLSHYSFNFTKLIRLRDEAKARADEMVAENVRQRTRTGTNHSPLQGTNGTGSDGFNSTRAASQGTQNRPQGTLQGPPIVPASGPNQLLYQPRGISAQLDHAGAPPLRLAASDAPSSSGGVAVEDRFQKGKFRKIGGGSPTAPKEGKEGAPKKEERPRHPLTPYPKLHSEFKHQPLVIEALMRRNLDDLTKASKLLATKGADVARDFILGIWL